MTASTAARPVEMSPGRPDRDAPRLIAVGAELWRVVAGSGRVLGHVHAHKEPDGLRFRARRYHPPSRAFRDLGDFWRADEAVDCLRYSR